MPYRWSPLLATALCLLFFSVQAVSASAPTIGRLTLTQEAELAGNYISKLSATPNTTRLTGAGQEIILDIQAGGLNTAKQVEFFIAAQPPEAFNLAAATFVPAAPYITIGSGVELVQDLRMRIGSITLQDGNFGDADLGTLTLTVSEAYDPGTAVSLQVQLLSIGPASDNREVYDEEVSCLEWLLKSPDTAVLGDSWGRIKALFGQPLAP